MFGDDIVVRTRLVPPRLPRRSLRRSRLDQLIANAAEYSLTIVHGSAGYGKTNLLATFAVTGGWPTIWYSIAAEDADPLVFLVQLVYACRAVAPTVGERTLARLERMGQSREEWQPALDALLNDLVAALSDDTILVLDDYQLVDDLPLIQALVTRLVAHHPPLLHIVLGTRQWPQLPILPTLQVRQEVCQIGEADLRFTHEEITLLFHVAYDRTLTVAEAELLASQSGGWVIALQLLAQSTLTTPDSPTPLLDDSTTDIHLPPVARDLLFAYLAQDVLLGQPPELQRFLLRSSVLTELDPVVCDRVLMSTTSAALLQLLYRRGLFLIPLGTNLYRYHPLFHAFLQERAQRMYADWSELHRRAADYYRTVGAADKVLHHLSQLGDLPAVADELELWAGRWLQSGRFTTLLDWLAQLPSSLLAAHPQLLMAQGDAARLLAHFELALHAYRTAETIAQARDDGPAQVRALQGQALIYLDTVEPAMADVLLRRAYKLLPLIDCTGRGALIRLLAENRLNQGRADQAVRLYRAADRLDPAARVDELQPRIYLRLGQLARARTQLLAVASAEQAALEMRQPEAHREATVLLALLSAMDGDGPGALRYAQQALTVARQVGSSLFEAVARIRLGHALQLTPAPDPSAANQQYLEAMALADSFGVERTKAEAYMGLALLHGFGGNLAAAQAAANVGLDIAEKSGDAWTTALLWTALGAVGVVGRAAEAINWLTTALQHYRRCHDTYGQTVIHLWLAIFYHRGGRSTEAAEHALQMLDLAHMHSYTGLFAAPTLFGPRDRMMLVPLLLAGRAEPHHAAQSQTLLQRNFPAIATDAAIEHYHPGVTLRLRTLGHLGVMRGNVDVPTHTWQRKKAPQLLALLLTERAHWFQREQICDRLWPEANAEEAEAQFKVTLNALQSVLEPGRPPRTAPCYIRRQGSSYRFLPSEGVWLDVTEFETRIDTGLQLLAAGGPADLVQAEHELSLAVGLYGGDYLSEFLYDEWHQVERERLATRYLQAGTALAELWLRFDRLGEAAQLCEVMLVHDPSWEDGYQLLMRVHDRQGNRRGALAVYERCVRNLRSHLDVAPLRETTLLYETIKR